MTGDDGAAQIPFGSDNSTKRCTTKNARHPDNGPEGQKPLFSESFLAAKSVFHSRFPPGGTTPCIPHGPLRAVSSSRLPSTNGCRYPPPGERTNSCAAEFFKRVESAVLKFKRIRNPLSSNPAFKKKPSSLPFFWIVKGYAPRELNA
jgi:hypothetical protein